MTITRPCFHFEACGQMVDPLARDTPRRVIAWEVKAPVRTSRKGGGDVVLREVRDEWLCRRCLERLKSGLDLQQEALL